MEQISLKIGERLKEIRNTRKITLDDAAELTGVSKPMSGQIERGQSSPAINVLWKISTGLKIPLSFFYKQQGSEYTVARPGVAEMITEEDGRMRAYPLFPFEPARNLEGFYIEFDAGVKHGSSQYAFLRMFPMHTTMFRIKYVQLCFSQNIFGGFFQGNTPFSSCLMILSVTILYTDLPISHNLPK